MIVDSSAVLAILFGESDATRFADAIRDAPHCRMTAATWLEAAIRVDALRDPLLSDGFDDLVRRAGIGIEAVTADHAQIARRAYLGYGKESGHPARLNFGDCFAYALAKSTGEPLLFKGDDFAHTDIEPA